MPRKQSKTLFEVFKPHGDFVLSDRVTDRWIVSGSTYRDGWRSKPFKRKIRTNPQNVFRILMSR